VPRDASAEEIRHAYLAKSARLRPERFARAPDDVVDAVTQAVAAIDEAWRVLAIPLFARSTTARLIARTSDDPARGADRQVGSGRWDVAAGQRLGQRLWRQGDKLQGHDRVFRADLKVP
jgi:hypothetical protein